MKMYINTRERHCYNHSLARINFDEMVKFKRLFIIVAIATELFSILLYNTDINKTKRKYNEVTSRDKVHGN